MAFVSFLDFLGLGTDPGTTAGLGPRGSEDSDSESGGERAGRPGRPKRSVDPPEEEEEEEEVPISPAPNRKGKKDRGRARQERQREQSRTSPTIQGQEGQEPAIRVRVPLPVHSAPQRGALPAAVDLSEDESSAHPELDRAIPSLRLAVAECLVGEPVRYDAGHCRNKFVLDTLNTFAELVPVCPEVGMGLDTPREVMKLVRSTGVAEDIRARGRARVVAGAALEGRSEGDIAGIGDIEDAAGGLIAPVPDDFCLVTRQSHEDMTARMWVWCDRKMKELQALGLDGFVLKAGSPTCGFDVPLFQDNLQRAADSRGGGLWFHMLSNFWPTLPLIDEERLADPMLREHFLTRAFAHWRFRRIWPRTVKTLGQFHAEHKYLLMAHKVRGVTDCGRIVAAWKSKYRDPEQMFADYYMAFFAALATVPTRGTWVNALQHVMGYLKNKITSEEKGVLMETLDDYKDGLVPLVVPLRLLQSHITTHKIDYVMNQKILAPAPRELKLGAHINEGLPKATVL